MPLGPSNSGTSVMLKKPAKAWSIITKLISRATTPTFIFVFMTFSQMTFNSLSTVTAAIAALTAKLDFAVGRCNYLEKVRGRYRMR